MAGRSREYLDGWKAAAHGIVLGNGTGAYNLGANDCEVAKKAAHIAAQKL